MADTALSAARQPVLLVNLALGVSSFLTLFDVTAVVVAMPALAKDLGFGVAGVAWVVDAYSLAFTAALVASGALADRFGRRRCLLAGNALFLAASLACGVASSGLTLLTARALQGLGAAFMTTGALALIAQVFPDMRQRAHAFGINGTIGGIAMALGPTLGGLLAAWQGWRWVFLANAPFCAALAVAVPLLVREAPQAVGRRIDVAGAVLLTVALGLIVDALLMHEGGIGLRVACLGGGAAVAWLFARRQARHPNPVFDPRLFATSAVAGACTLIVVIQFGYWAAVVYLPLFLSTVLHMRPDAAGLGLLAATLPMLLVPLVGGQLAVRWGWRGLFQLAFTLMAAGDTLLMVAALWGSPASRLVTAVAGMAATGIGAALANPQVSGVVLARVTPVQSGMASALVMITRQAGFATSIACLGAVLGITGVGFAGPFALAAAAAAVGIAVARRLLSGQG